MNPTEIYQYKPQLKRTIYNYSFSQIVNLPGYMEKYDSINLKEKKKGKKMFLPKDNEKKVGQGRNKNRKKKIKKRKRRKRKKSKKSTNKKK